jgi:hypothetical protein
VEAALTGGKVRSRRGRGVRSVRRVVRGRRVGPTGTWGQSGCARGRSVGWTLGPGVESPDLSP